MPSLLIFDLDGTLVDSEGLYNQALLDLLPDLHDPVPALVDRYRGLRLRVVLDDLERRLERRLPDDFELRYRQRVHDLFDTGALSAMPGAAQMLADLDRPYCLASNGPMAKIQQALVVTGLDRHFGGNLFSAYQVGAWKPDPRLFLHAAATMATAPGDCLVIEDSEPGLQAAAAAGMPVLHFRSAGFATSAHVGFDDLLQLPSMLGSR